MDATPSATEGAVFSQTLISEDFGASAANFTVVAGGTWALANGAYALSAPATAATPLANLSVHRTSVPRDFALTARVTPTGSGAWDDAAVVFGYVDARNYYYVALNEQNDNLTSGVFRLANGVLTELRDITTPVHNGTTYAVAVTADAGALRVTLNGTEVAALSNLTLPAGRVGFATRNDPARFDDLRVNIAAPDAGTTPSTDSGSTTPDAGAMDAAAPPTDSGTPLPPTDSGTVPPPADAGSGTLRSSITQYGITWTFDRAYPTGQFVNGDWWVVGPVTVVSVSPGPSVAPSNEVNDLGVNSWGDTGLRDDRSRRNGSMVVLTPSDRQGYDSRGITYSASASITFPYALAANRSLISSVSHVTIPNTVMHEALMWTSEKRANNVMRTAAVLTCLSTVPPADAFRPTYIGTDKRIFRASSLRWDRLRTLPIDATRLPVPSWAQYERYLQRPWLDHLDGAWVGQWLLPTENQPAYGREFARIVGTATLMLQLDVPREQKQRLLYELVQYGIDVRGIAQAGGYWNEGGGHTSGRKWPVVFAGLMLDDPYFTSMPASAVFHEDTQTYWGNGWHRHTALYQMVEHHGTRQPYEHKQPSSWDSWDQTSEDYRLCCNTRAWVAEGLGALLMSAQRAWDHDVFFANIEDWMRQEDLYAAYRGGRARPSEERTTFDPFVDAFWRLHRAAVPAQPTGVNNLMWDVNVSGAIKWVANPRP